MCERDRVAGVLELPNQLLERQQLAGVVATEPEELTDERWLIDPGQQQEVAREGWFR